MEDRAMVGPQPAKAAKARELCAQMLKLLGAEAEVDAQDGAESINLRVTGKGQGELALGAGRSAVTDALGHLLNKVLNRGEDKKYITVAVGEFRAETDPEMARMALELAERVKRTQKGIAVGPMSAPDRRQVHMAIAGVEGIYTQSEGEGVARRLWILPGEKPAHAPGGRRPPGDRGAPRG